MHVLFVGFVWPEPTSSAAGQNILSYMRTAKEQNWNVSFCSAAQTTPQTFNLASIQVNAFSIALNSSSFDEMVARLQPNIVIFDRYLSFEQFAWRVKQTCPQAMLVLDAEDLHFLRAARHALVKQQKQSRSFMQSNDVLQTHNIKHLHNEIALREIACMLQADLTIVLSNFEQRLLVDYFKIPSNQVSHLPFILQNIDGDTTKYAINDALPTSLESSFSDKQNFVFIGNFRHAPNYHAVKILAEQCWPAIYKALHKEYPGITCNIYGAYMPGKAKQLENKKIGLLMHGFALDQFEVIKRARVMLAPISFGAGVKGKLLDAISCGTPNVTTPIGCEGISEKPWAGIEASSIDEFVNGAIGLYTDEEKWWESVKAGKEILRHDYNTVQNTTYFIETIRQKYESFVDDRQHNFMQNMLNHHQFQTSKYMSQWIEAKNRLQN